MEESQPIEIVENKAYTTQELSEILRITLQTAKKIIGEKELYAKKVGNKYLILGSEILNYLQSKND